MNGHSDSRKAESGTGLSARYRLERCPPPLESNYRPRRLPFFQLLPLLPSAYDAARPRR